MNVFITAQEEQLLGLLKERKSLSLDALYEEIYKRRLFTRSWLIKNSLKRLYSYGLVKIIDNRIFLKENLIKND